MEPADKRKHYIDWMRILAFGLLILIHGMVPFTAIPWEINNSSSSYTLTRFTFWLHQWRLPLLFFVSGLGIRFSLSSRSILAFYGERTRRLLIPLLFAMFFTIPIQPYFEFLQRGKIEPGYLEFYKQVWEFKVYPDGPLTWSHMWFVVYLIAFIILLLPLFMAGKQKTLARWLERAGEWLGRPLALVLMVIPVILVIHGLYLQYPQNGSLTEDWFAFSFFLLMLVYGYLIGNSSTFWETAARYRWVNAVITLLVAYWRPIAEFKSADRSFSIYAVVNGILIWSMLLCWCGMARQYLHRPSPVLNYLNKAIYPYFIIHQTIMVALGYYIVQWPLPLGIKCLALILLSVALILSVYHFIIRKTRLTRFLFGMKD
jgi:glucans biosynthesis protein C